MSIQGIGIDVTFVPPVPFTDEWLDAVYTSLEKNMAIVSIDMFVTEDEGRISFTLGIDNPFGSDDFTENVAREAIDKAFADAAGPNTQNIDNEVHAGKVEVFA
ncbi:hypothetical protein [Microbacterium sp.]|uniref:hypothetical protein n=1 Tax=Microbacterium sp. TaxID=51671 RepID=UPI00324237E5